MIGPLVSQMALMRNMFLSASLGHVSVVKLAQGLRVPIVLSVPQERRRRRTHPRNTGKALGDVKECPWREVEGVNHPEIFPGRSQLRTHPKQKQAHETTGYASSRYGRAHYRG